MTARSLAFLLALSIFPGIAAAQRTPLPTDTQEATPVTTEQQWISALVKRLMRAKHTTSDAREKATPGDHEVHVSFRVSRNGEISDVKIARRSGQDAVDASAVASVVHASPVPAFPAVMEGESRDFVVPFVFVISPRAQETEGGEASGPSSRAKEKQFH